jgi:hypothetical protein
MTIKKPLHHYAHMSHPATDHPVLLIDANAPLRDLHACAAERLNAVLNTSTSSHASASPTMQNTT